MTVILKMKNPKSLKLKTFQDSVNFNFANKLKL